MYGNQIVLLLHQSCLHEPDFTGEWNAVVVHDMKPDKEKDVQMTQHVRGWTATDLCTNCVNNSLPP